MIAEIKAKNLNWEPPSLWFYFGLNDAAGHRDTRFADMVKAIWRQTVDLIFFGELLMNDLISHGRRLMKREAELLKGRGVKLIEMNFTDARAGGLFPNEEQYEEWIQGFPGAAQQGS